ncbi:MAG: molybdenum cofactor synthesis protein [Lentisphaerae bacterium RIFOXYB12_FULL_65_16]|nr:MAG: molybdenum cofactor synthesis protein [Lentisphaerae bacterium RIFOXYA12_64_32]OGV92868.1 MAG: molybdenum cofactor synthesis protein [Lentisphaerae bacterium RIFOXYB12_FULL_65_16]
MSERIEVVSVNVSEKKGTRKSAVGAITLDELGVVGDAHAGPWHRQVSILSQELIAEFSTRHGRTITPGEFAENITLRGLDLRQVAPLDRLHVGAAEVEVTQIGKECHGDACAIYREVGTCLMPKDGLFARVVRGGTVTAGDPVRYCPHKLRVVIVTLSDRASAGVYEDRSGPRTEQLLAAFFADKRWHLAFDRRLLPDDAGKLRDTIGEVVRAGADIVFTVGSTGVGPRDIAPNVVTPLCDKLIPGVMEYIRIKSAARAPAALLSRSVAGVIGTTLIFTLPGSVRAVEDYLEEIVRNLEHLLYMVHAIDRHCC